MSIQSAVEEIQQSIPGYHIEISIYPSGGMIDANPCDECKSTGYYSASWSYKRGRNKSIDDAVFNIKSKIDADKNK